MPLPFRIFKLRGDGSLQFVEEAHTLEDAIESARDLAQLWPGEYIIQNEETGERVSITAGRKPSEVRWGVRYAVVDLIGERF
jgi:hypothetical protein